MDPKRKTLSTRYFKKVNRTHYFGEDGIIVGVKNNDAINIDKWVYFDHDDHYIDSDLSLPILIERQRITLC